MKKPTGQRAATVQANKPTAPASTTTGPARRAATNIGGRAQSDAPRSVLRCPRYPDCPNGNNFCPLGVHPSPKRLCGFLPCCTRGVTCTYFHPICDLPNCVGGKKCSFLHPKNGAPNIAAFRLPKGFVMPRQGDYLPGAVGVTSKLE